MAILRLFDPSPAHPDGSHHMAAPGGYESWRFYAHDPSQNLRLVFGFHHGYCLHPDYVRRFTTYRRRPTRHAPPVPAFYPCLTVSIYEGLQPLASSTIQYPPGSFLSADCSLSLKANRLNFCASEITAEIPSAKTTFELAFPISTEKVFPPPAANGIEHHWRYAAPICNVRADIRLPNQTISFQGVGQYNYYYGSGPPGSSANRWMRGQIVFPKAAINFLAADDRAIVFAADESGIREIDDSAISAQWDRQSLWSPPYATSLDFGRWLVLRNPRIANSSPASLAIVYDAYIDGQQSPAWVEIDYPNRLQSFFTAWQAKRKFSIS